MSIQNPAGLYSGGQGIFNSTPFTQFVLKQHAIKEAKDEALDKYYNNLPNTINEQGVRDNEIPIIHDKKDEIQQYYQQNRDAIKKGNTPEAFNLGKKFREAQAAIQESKNRVNTDKTLAQWRGDPKKAYIFNNPNFIEAQRRHSLPINDPESEAIDLGKLALPPKPLDVNGVVKKYADIKYDDGVPDITPHPTDKLKSVYTSKPMLGEQGKSAIQERAASQYDNEPDFANEIDNLSQHPDHLIGLNALHQKVFGKPISFDADGNINKHDLSAAYVASVLPEKSLKVEVKDNKSAIMDRQYQDWLKKFNLQDAAKTKRMYFMFGQNHPEITPDSVPDEMGDYQSKGKTVVGNWANNNEPEVHVDIKDISPERVKQLGKPFNDNGAKYFKIVTDTKGTKSLQSQSGSITDKQMTQDWLDKHASTAQKVRNTNKFPATQNSSGKVKLHW